jgi:hypothetical protein
MNFLVLIGLAIGVIVIIVLVLGSLRVRASKSGTSSAKTDEAMRGTEGPDNEIS